MPKRLLTLLICVLALNLAAFAAPKKAAASGPGPDKAYLQKVLDGWSSLNPADMAQYYATDDRLFFDIAPVKYNSWSEYQTGVTELLKGYKSLKLTMNDDVQIHREGNLTWAVATLKEEAVTGTGKHELSTLRWTVILEKQPTGKWLITHEHTSAPLS